MADHGRCLLHPDGERQSRTRGRHPDAAISVHWPRAGASRWHHPAAAAPIGLFGPSTPLCPVFSLALTFFGSLALWLSSSLTLGLAKLCRTAFNLAHLLGPNPGEAYARPR
ncbi:hypothetical protein BKA56DRAFT_651302, partial [Ilyonectria sp. MPI-CAGE-AT-0026]